MYAIPYKLNNSYTNYVVVDYDDTNKSADQYTKQRKPLEWKRGNKVRHDFHGVGVISCISDHSITVHFKNSTINRKLKNFQVTCSFDKKPSEVESLSLCY